MYTIVTSLSGTDGQMCCVECTHSRGLNDEQRPIKHSVTVFMLISSFSVESQRGKIKTKAEF